MDNSKLSICQPKVLVWFPNRFSRRLRSPWLLAGVLWLSNVYEIAGVAHGQPALAPDVASPATVADIQSTVEALVESTQSDGGSDLAQTLVVGASKSGRVARAWQEWRRAALSSADNSLHLRLRVQDVQVQKFDHRRDAGGFALRAATAQVTVHLDVASGSLAQPVAEWPAEPWQGEFTLTRSDAEDGLWQFEEAPEGETPGAATVGVNAAGVDAGDLVKPGVGPGVEPGKDGPFIEISERGGNRLEQAIQVIRQPTAMLRTTLLRADRQSLLLVMDSVARYAAATGHYPPSDYSAALLKNEPQKTRPALRLAFQVAGTTRSWVLCPALAGQPVPVSPEIVPPQSELPQPETQPREAEPRDAQPQEVPPIDVPLFWDGTPQQPYARFAGQSVIAFADGRVELRRAQDLQFPALAKE